MTSIVRTYYSFQVPKSSDKTYNLQLMSLWGWAELAIGIIVGCLPVMPKFIQHVGPQIFKTLSFGSKYEVKPAHGLNAIDEVSKANTFTRIQRPFAKYGGPSISKSLTDPYDPQTRLHGDYPTSEIFGSSLPDAIIAHESTRPSGGTVATKRDDLEYGQSRI